MALLNVFVAWAFFAAAAVQWRRGTHPQLAGAVSRYWPFSDAGWRAVARAWPTVVVATGAMALFGTAELTLADTAAAKPVAVLLSLAETLPLVLTLGIVLWNRPRWAVPRKARSAPGFLRDRRSRLPER